jgi:hypothetical protein
MLRASQSAQDGGYERLQQQAEDDEQDKSQCIFHNLEFISFPFVPGLPAPGMRIFFCFRKASPFDEGKPETENTLPSERKIVSLPCPQVWLDASMGELRFAGKDIRQSPGPHERFYRFRSKEERRSRAMYL